jgi:hypothetical protein
MADATTPMVETVSLPFTLLPMILSVVNTPRFAFLFSTTLSTISPRFYGSHFRPDGVCYVSETLSLPDACADVYPHIST